MRSAAERAADRLDGLRRKKKQALIVCARRAARKASCKKLNFRDLQERKSTQVEILLAKAPDSGFAKKDFLQILEISGSARNDSQFTAAECPNNVQTRLPAESKPAGAPQKKTARATAHLPGALQERFLAKT